MLYLADVDVVAINQLIEFGGQGVQEPLDGARELLHFAAADVGSGDVPAQGLDVDIDVDGPVPQFANAVFEFGGLAVRVAKTEVFVDLEVEFHEKLILLLEGAHVVNGQAHALGDGTDGFKQGARLAGRGARRGPSRRTARFRRCVFRWRR